MILRWTDSRDGLEHEMPVDCVEVRPDGWVEAYAYRAIPMAEFQHLSERRLVGIRQLAPSEVLGRVLVVA